MGTVRTAVIILLLLAACIAHGAPQLFTVNLDTSTVSGTSGYLEIAFGSVSLAADAGTLSILGFSSDALLGGSFVLSGNVLGSLPGSVVLDNQPPPGAYYQQALTFGNLIAFSLVLNGPLVNTPTGGPDGSSFAVWLLDDTFSPLLAVDALFSADIDGSGLISLNNFSAAADVSGPFQAVPEPAAIGLTALGMAGLLLFRRR